jgi:hypothetical protein
MVLNARRHGLRFIEAQEELIEKLQIEFLEYAKTLLNPTAVGSKNSSDAIPNQATTPHVNMGNDPQSGKARKSKWDLETQDGFPKMPAVGAKELKDDLEDLLRKYLAAQYRKLSRRHTATHIHCLEQSSRPAIHRNEFHLVLCRRTNVSLLTQNIIQSDSSSRIPVTSRRTLFWNSVGTFINER